MAGRIVIAGAGPAGASLAIRLAEKKFQVTLVERERFPREKLCGEFISPECFRHFRELGVSSEMFEAGGERVEETVFYSPSGRSVAVPSNWFASGDSALGLSRAAMDDLLLNRARSAGVDVLTETAAAGIQVDGGRAVGLKVNDDRGSRVISGDLFVDATGRTRILTKLLTRAKTTFREPDRQPPKFVAFKAHLKKALGEPRKCEIYSFPGGYGGLNYVENGKANFCFIVRADVVRRLKGNAAQIIEHVVMKNCRAAETLAGAEPVHGWLAVSIDSFGEQNLNPFPGVFNIGDAAAFIDPFTGSGMLMAFQGSEIFADCITEYGLRNSLIAVKYQQAFSTRFSKRLHICRFLRHAAYSPAAAAFLIAVLSISGRARRSLAGATRGR